VDEVLGYYSSIPQPSGYIIHEPREFNKWAEWAQQYKPKQDMSIMPLGIGETARTFNEMMEKI